MTTIMPITHVGSLDELRQLTASGRASSVSAFRLCPQQKTSNRLQQWTTRNRSQMSHKGPIAPKGTCGRASRCASYKTTDRDREFTDTIRAASSSKKVRPIAPAGE